MGRPYVQRAGADLDRPRTGPDPRSAVGSPGDTPGHREHVPDHGRSFLILSMLGDHRTSGGHGRPPRPSRAQVRPSFPDRCGSAAKLADAVRIFDEVFGSKPSSSGGRSWSRQGRLVSRTAPEEIFDDPRPSPTVSCAPSTTRPGRFAFPSLRSSSTRKVATAPAPDFGEHPTTSWVSSASPATRSPPCEPKAWCPDRLLGRPPPTSQARTALEGARPPKGGAGGDSGGGGGSMSVCFGACGPDKQA